MQVRVRHDIGDLANDLASIARRAPKDLRGVVREAVKVGNSVAKDNARRSSGTHGRRYPASFSAQMNSGGGLFGNTYSGEYGPTIGRAQGGMSFEFGSRNQKPHLDLARSADLIAPTFAQEVRAVAELWFW